MAHLGVAGRKGVDLNDLVNPTSIVADTPRNGPLTTDSLLLIKVETVRGEDSRLVIQRAYAMNEGAEYIRTYAGDWSEWKATAPSKDHYATREDLNRVAVGRGEVKDADAFHAGFMTTKHVEKLESLEHGATRDLSASEILEQLKTVDGKDSGLDADTLRGQQPEDFAPAKHVHPEYALADDVAAALKDYVKFNDLTDDFVLRLMERIQEQLDVGMLGGKRADDFVLASELTGDKLVRLLDGVRGINATSLGGRDASQFALANHTHDGRYEPRNRDLLKSNEPHFLTVGVRQESVNIGIVKDGAFTPNPDKGLIQRYTNGGAHVFNAPTATDDYEMVVVVVNGPKAGTITLDGFTTRFDPIPPYPGSKFIFRILKVNETTDLEWKIVTGA